MQKVAENNFIGHFILSLVALSIFFANIWYSGLWYPEAPSHALNGVFYKDMIEQGGVFHPTSYAERYYVQYPSLTIGYYPPVFYTIEALFFKLFGVSPLVARLAVLLFTLLAVNIFFLICRLWFPLWLSITGSILYLLQPATLFGQKNVMLEIPALAMSMLALYWLYIGTEKDSSWGLFLAPVFAALAFLTKQNCVFLLPLSLVLVIWSRRWRIIKSAHFISGVLLGTLILIPWLIVNLTISRFYVVAAVFQGHHIWSNLVYYLRHSFEIISIPVILLSIFSSALFIKLKKYESYRFGLLWVCSVLLFLLLVDWTEPRQAIYLTPALIMLSMQIIWVFRDKFRPKSLYGIIMILLICLHLIPQKAWSGRDIRGFHQAADFVVRDPDCVSVLYDGYFNGNFIFHMRARDKERRVFVFRTSKVIFSTKMGSKYGYNELIRGVSEFYDMINRYSIKYIVQEERDLMKTPANRRLREWIQGPEFRLVQKYSIACKGLNGFGDLLVYEYLDYQAKSITEINLDMPVMGRKISVKLE